ncbi:hypothetical protein [Halapricum salinum]|nr:hypothetical protein [Halapricum salinum]
MNIEIDDTLYERIDDRAARKEFESADEYAETILRIVLDELEDEPDRDVQDRLEDLGYM